MMPNDLPGLRASVEWDLRDLIVSLGGEDMAATFYKLLDEDPAKEASGAPRPAPAVEP